MQQRTNTAVIAAAGALKTQHIVDAALSSSERILITTYTNENLNQIRSRISGRSGVIPANIDVSGWFSFLLANGVRPYQSSVLGAPGIVGGLNFVGQRGQYVPSSSRAYFVDGNRDLWRDAVADFTCRANAATNGAVINRLARIYDHIFIDEIQDLVGYDLNVLDQLFSSSIKITVVGDLRQYTFSTSNVAKNKKYRGQGFAKWLDERSDLCNRVHRNESARCSEGICAFASELFPEFDALTSGHSDVTGHDGIHMVSTFEALTYYDKHRPQVLRWNRSADTNGLPALNIGLSKGSTYDRVLIFPTKPMLQYLEHRDPAKLKTREMLYVAVTRARHSAAFVVPPDLAD